MIKSSLLRLILILLFLCINAQKLFKNMILHFKNISWMRWNTIFYQILNKWARWKIKHILLKVRSSEIKCKNVYQQWAISTTRNYGPYAAPSDTMITNACWIFCLCSDLSQKLNPYKFSGLWLVNIHQFVRSHCSILRTHSSLQAQAEIFW